MQKRRLERLGFPVVDDAEKLTSEQRRRFSRLNIDSSTVQWNRVMDTNDRFLRKIEVGLAPSEKGHSRESNFMISVASEVSIWNTIQQKGLL